MPATKGLFDAMKDKVFSLEMHLSSDAILANVLTKLEELLKKLIVLGAPVDFPGGELLDHFKQSGAKLAEWCGLVAKTVENSKVVPVSENIAKIATAAWQIYAHMDASLWVRQFERSTKETLKVDVLAGIAANQKLAHDVVVRRTT
jgi:hypothetical protein